MTAFIVPPTKSDSTTEILGRLKQCYCSNLVSNPHSPLDDMDGYLRFSPELQFSQFAFVCVHGKFYIKACIATSDVEKMQPCEVIGTGQLVFPHSNPIQCSFILIHMQP